MTTMIRMSRRNRLYLLECLSAGFFFAVGFLGVSMLAWLSMGEEAARHATIGAAFAAAVGWLSFIGIWGATRDDCLDLLRREADIKRRERERERAERQLHG